MLMFDPESEMLQGYLDGLNLDNPNPSSNRSHSYRHGFANGRDDRRKKPRASASTLREWADDAIEKDLESCYH
jgi:hypothetical protein